MSIYADLSNGELLGQLRAIAQEGVERLADIVELAKYSDEALSEGHRFAQKLDDALDPSVGEKWDGSVWWLKRDLDKIASARPDEEPSDEWDGFLDSHPELKEQQQTGTATATASRPQVVTVPAVDDDAVIAAVAAAIRQQCEYHDRLFGSHSWHSERADARAVACVLAGQEPLGYSCELSHSDLIKLGQRLGKLSREGSVRRVSRSYERRAYYAPLEAGSGED